MANLRWFRRHQKIMLVVFGVILMAVFGLGSVISMIPPAGTQDNRDEMRKVIARWKGGKFTRQDVSQLTRLHFQTMEFIQFIDRAKMGEQGINFKREVFLINPLQTDGASPEQVDDAIITRMLLAAKAKEMGLVVGDSEVNEYVQKLSYERLDDQTLRQINFDINGNSVDLKSVLDHLKTELLALKMSQLISTGYASTPNPMEGFQSYLKLNRRIECQVYPFKVDDYLDQVSGEPTNAEINELFAEGRYEYPSFDHKDPGFKELRKLDIQYFVGDLNAFLDIEKAKLTPEEIKAEYDRLVKEKDPLVVVPVESTNESGDDLSIDGDKDGDDNEAPKPGDDGKSDDKKSKKSDDKKSEKSDDKKSEGDKKEAPKKQALNVSGANAVYTSTQEKSDGKKQETEKSDPAKQENKDGDPAPKPSTQEKGEGKSAEEQDKNSGGPVEPADPVQEEKPKTRVKELKEVEDEIKKRLKQDDAQKALTEALEAATKEVQYHGEEYAVYMSEKDKNEDLNPGEFDVKGHADRNKLGFGELGFQDSNTVAETELGKVTTFMFNAQRQMVFPTIGQKLFSNYHNLREYQPIQDTDFQNNKTYVYWVVEKKEPHVLELADAREKVIEYWRYKEAQKLCKAAADAFAEKVNQAKAEMVTVEKEAKLTGSFSWFQSLSPQMGQQARLQFGTVTNAEAAGEEFMRTAFGLNELETGVAPDRFNEVYFAVQLINKVKPISGIPYSKQYLGELNRYKRLPPGVGQVSQRYNVELQQRWLSNFAKEMELEYEIY